jgi:predicted transcriptional regulator of viral defense system
MDFITFQSSFRDSALIELQEVLKAFPDFHSRRLADWQQKNYIQKIINRFYRWTDQPLTELLTFFIANRIYRDSYVSLWTALSYYGLIPEGVYQTYSVSTHKTKTFETPIGTFVYQHIKSPLFFGYCIQRWENKPILLAEPEKALLDTLYLNPQYKGQADLDALRLNWQTLADLVQPAIIEEYATFYQNARVTQLANLLVRQLTTAHD